MTKPKQYKVLDMAVDDMRIYCIKRTTDNETPYRVYFKWYYYNGDMDYGYHTKQIVKYANMVSVIDFIRNWMYHEHKGFTEGA